MIDETKTFELFGYTSDSLTKSSHKKFVRVCDECGKVDVIEFRRYNISEHPNLCVACVIKGEKITLGCKQCGKEFDVSINRKDTAKFCSPKCMNKWRAENLVGENHPKWNPDITDEKRVSGRFIHGYKQWRKDVYKRDNYTCQVCGDSSIKNLITHHIESYYNNPELRTELSNGITMCECCHRNFHRLYGLTNNTRYQYDEFVKMQSFR